MQGIDNTVCLGEGDNRNGRNKIIITMSSLSALPVGPLPLIGEIVHLHRRDAGKLWVAVYDLPRIHKFFTIFLYERLDPLGIARDMHDERKTAADHMEVFINILLQSALPGHG